MQAEHDAHAADPYAHHVPTLDTDTNARTLCAAGQYLDGDGTCKTVSTVSAGDFDLLMTKIDNLAHLQASGASAYVFVTSGAVTGNLVDRV